MRQLAGTTFEESESELVNVLTVKSISLQMMILKKLQQTVDTEGNPGLDKAILKAYAKWASPLYLLTKKSQSFNLFN